jgi:hypothetical protein
MVFWSSISSTMIFLCRVLLEQVNVTNGVCEFIKSLTEATKGLHDVVHETDADFLSSKMAELKLYEDAPEMLLVRIFKFLFLCWKTW